MVIKKFGTSSEGIPNDGTDR